MLQEIDELEQGARPHGVTEQRWFTLLKDLRSFTEQWLDLALGCGWALQDIYGAPVEMHLRRVCDYGAVLLLEGRPVLSIDPNRIVIGNANLPPHTFYRNAPGVSVPFDRSRVSLLWHSLRRTRGRRAQW